MKNKNYQALQWGRRVAWLLVLLLSKTMAQAQSGPVGNEWIVPSQQYYKIKITKDGLYKLDYQYLTQSGISGVAPSQLQIWRRGQELARYVGGNTSTLDATTFIEFYAVHNDGKLEGELYKRPQDQPHQLFNFYSDTASYFITWSVGAAARPGRAMAQPTVAGGAVHPYRLASALYLHTNDFKDRNYGLQPSTQYLPWIEPGEGFFWQITSNLATNQPVLSPSPAAFNATDSTTRSISPLGPAPTVEVVVFGVTEAQHKTEVLVIPPTGPERVLGVIQYQGFSRGRETFAIQRSDINSAGRAVVRVRTLAPAIPRDFFALCYVRLVAPQTSRWFADRSLVAFKNDSLLTGPATYELDSIPATVAGFDVQDFYNVQRIVGTPGAGNTRRFVFPGATANATHQLLLADESHLLVPPLPARRVRFRQINPAQPNYIIITHPQLMKPAPGTTNAALSYASYKANPGGGVMRYDTLMMTTFQLYDQFNYGDRSWLALRHFARWMAAATPGSTSRYLLLLGKGIVPSEYINGVNFRQGGEQGQDLVPTSTRSVSDNMISADFANNDFSAKLNTGRLTVTTPGQIMAYLAKLRQYDALGDQAWRKNVLHLVAGSSPAEGVRFRSYMDTYKRKVERPLFGGQVTTIERSTTSTALFTSINIDNYLTSGLGLISYFGHGSNTTMGLDIGRVTDPSYSNPNGKYPVMLYNGCAAGHLYTVGATTFFENWLFTPNKGAIGAMGQYGFSYEDLLDPVQDTLYKLMFNNPQWYGKPVTAVYNETVRRLQRLPNSSTNYNPFYGTTDERAVEQLLCTVWHGDPTISLYAPPKPDFQVTNAGLSIVPGPGLTAVSATSANFQLNIAVTNPGKVTTDSVEIRVTRIYDPNINTTTPPTITTYKFVQGLQGSGNYSVLLPNTAGVNVFGNNTFRVELDYRNRVDESNEGNNSATITYTFLRGGITVLNPLEFAIVGNNRPNLVAQTNDPNGPQRVYEFEVDTVATFNSSLKMQSGPVTTTLTPSWRPTLPAVGRDSVVWYWRVRFQTPAGDEDPNWVVSSFRVIPGRNAGGWSQSHYAQFRRDQRQGVDVAAPNGRWDFSAQKQPLLLRTQGGGVAGAAPTFGNGIGFGITANVLTPPGVANCGIYSNNLMIAVYDQYTLRPITGLTAPGVCGLAPQQFYIFANPASPLDTVNTLNGSVARQAELATFLASVPDGAYVAVASMNRLRWASLTTVRTAFTTLLGSQLINQLQNGDPFTLIAQKRASGGRLIRELGPQTGASSTIPRYDQIISLTDTLRAPSSNGVVTSTRIGPAQSWDKLFHWIKREPGATSSFTLKVIGISANNQATVLATVPANSGRSGYALNTISAAAYPYLQLELTMKDSLRRTAPQLKEWFVTYQGVPEGVVRRDLVTPTTAYDAASLSAQAKAEGKVRIPVVFQNVTPFDFGTPLRAKVEVRDDAGTALAPVYVNAPRQLKGDSTITINAEVPFVGNFGTFTAKVTVNPTPNALPEINLFNNELNIGAFPVVDTNVPPTLDVAFDGRHILNGELVSPRPVINIQLSDEDKLRHITDRSAFTVTLRRPGANSTATLVDLSNSNEVQFTTDVSNGSVAKLTYEPGKTTALDDGVYTLRVQGRDPSNATAAAQDFQVNFEVVKASQITNVYPYPNPIVGKARFVFTLTGQQLPRNMKIQIMSLTGRVVREIFMNELGPLHIGNNITDFAWDGTDTYGDRLANGTYLYRVALDDAEGQFSHRATAGDKAFKNDWGKLVLMR